VVDVTQSLAMAQMQQLSALQQSSTNLRTMEKELKDINVALRAASDIPSSEIFGGLLSDAAGAKAIDNAATSIEKVMTAIGKGGTTAAMAHESIELARQSLMALGGDTVAVDRLINSMVAGYMEVRRLEGGIKSLSQSIMNIPNKIVSIGIQQYEVPASGGGTTGVRVHGGEADMSYQSYSLGGKTIGVSSGNGPAVRTQGYLVDQSDIQTMLELQGKRAAGGPVSGGDLYLVGEQGPELLKMSGAGNVTNANSTASILSGGRDMLSLIEDNTYNIMAELRIHTRFWETNDDDNNQILAMLKKLESYGVSSSSSGGGSRSSYSSGSSYSGSSGSEGQSHLDPFAPYYFNAARNNAGRGGDRYDPVADALMNGNTEALRGLSGGPTEALSRALGAISGSGGPSLLDRLKKHAGFATAVRSWPAKINESSFSSAVGKE